MKKIKLTDGRNFLGFDKDYTVYENLINDFDLYLIEEKINHIGRIGSDVLYVESKNFKTNLVLSDGYILSDPINFKESIKINNLYSGIEFEVSSDKIPQCLKFIKGNYDVIFDVKSVTKKLVESGITVKRLVSKSEQHIFSYDGKKLTYKYWN